MNFLCDVIIKAGNVIMDFNHIVCDYIPPDYSLETTAKILLASRVPMSELFNIDYYNSLGDVKNLTPNSFMIIQTENYEDEVRKLQKSSQFRKIGKLQPFIRETVEDFICEQKNIGVVIIPSDDIQVYQKVQCAIPILFPKYFKDKPLTEFEKRFIGVIAKNDLPKYLDMVIEYAETLGIREKQMEEAIEEYFKAVSYETKSRLNEERDKIMANIETFLATLSDFYADLEKVNLQIGGLKSANELEAIENFKSVIKKSKNLRVVLGNHNSLIIVASGYMDVYDEIIAERVIKNNYSTLYSGNGRFDSDGIRLLFENIFIKGLLKIKTCAAYRITPDRKDIQAYSFFVFPEELNEYMPNPHINSYSCLGSYAGEMCAALNSGNYEALVYMCINSCRSINFADLTVMRELVKQLISSNRKCIEFPDGKCVTPINAIKMLKEMENNE